LRSFAHWTPRYIADRSIQIARQRKFAKSPWLTPDAIRFLDDWLKPSDVAVEFGAGRSTKWFAERVGRLVSVESDETWYKRVRADLPANTAIHLAPTANEALAAVSDLAEASIDFCLVDGGVRHHVAPWAASRMKPGGLLVVDNANWFLTNQSRAPKSTRVSLPEWLPFEEATDGWRRHWTTDGVTSTLLLFAPA
jgi:predicted O-methyltransferase YrrM